jgi:thioesterase domain-containing protein
MQPSLLLDPRKQPAERSTAPKSGASQPDEWVVTFRAAGAAPPLFCVCSGGGDVSDFGDLAQLLPVGQPVIGFGVPPFEMVGDRFPSIQQLAAIYVAKLLTLQPHGPYYLCGHSFGGVVAYEMAALLVKAGEPIGFVGLIDTLHPAFRRDLSPSRRLQFRSDYMADRIAKYARNLRRGGIRQIVADARYFVRRRARLARWKIGRLVSGRSGTTNTNEMVLVAAWDRYQSTSFNGRVVMFNAADRPLEFGRDRTLGWGKYVSGDIDIHVVLGDHLSIMHPPDVLSLAERIVPYLARI